MRKRYSYKLKGGGLVISDYAAKAPATTAIYDHIRYLHREELRKAGEYGAPGLTPKEVKEIAAKDYVLVTFVLVEEGKLESLKDRSKKLSCLEGGGVDNWSYYYDSLKEGGYFEDDEE